MFQLLVVAVALAGQALAEDDYPYSENEGEIENLRDIPVEAPRPAKADEEWESIPFNPLEPPLPTTQAEASPESETVLALKEELKEAREKLRQAEKDEKGVKFLLFIAIALFIYRCVSFRFS